jgi:hypothetical protein
MSFITKYMHVIIILTLMITVIPSVCFGGDKAIEKVVFYDGMTLYGKLNDGIKFKVSIFIEPYRDNGAKVINKFWGFDRDKPTFLIKSIRLSIGGKDVKIPAEAFKDLADIILPSGLYIMQKKEAVVLYIKGGDAAGSYKASLRFNNNKLVSRTIEFVNPEGELDSITIKY